MIAAGPAASAGKEPDGGGAAGDAAALSRRRGFTASGKLLDGKPAKPVSAL